VTRKDTTGFESGKTDFLGVGNNSLIYLYYLVIYNIHCVYRFLQV
jgi:hypothetical protein